MATAARTIGIRLTLEEADQFRSLLKGLGTDGEGALKKISDASARTGQSLDDTTTKTKTFSRATTDSAAAADALTSKMAQAQVQLRAMADQTARMQAAQVQSTVNSFAGVQTSSAADYRKRAEDMQAAFAAADKLRGSLIPLAAAEQAHAEQLARIAQAEKTGVISGGEAITARQKAQVSFQQMTKAARESGQGIEQTAASGKLASYQLVQMGQEVHKFADQVIAGGSAMKAAAFQLPNIISSGGGVRNIIGAAAGSFGLLGAGAVIAATGITAVVVAAEAADARMVKLRNSLVAFSDDYAALANRVDASSRQQARETGESYSTIAKAQTAILQVRPSLNNDEVQQSVDLGLKLARTMDGDVAKAMQVVAGIAKNPTEAIKQLSEQGYRGLTTEVLRNIDALQRSGQSTAAVMAGMEAVKRAVGGAEETGLQKAIHTLSGEWGTFWHNIEQGVAGPGEKLLGWLAGTLAAVNRFNQPGPGSTLATPTGAGYQYAGTTDFKKALAAQESSTNPTRVNAEGYLGLYQMGAARLSDLGLYRGAPGENLRANQFAGTFSIPGFDGVRTKADFLGNAQAQQVAFDREIAQTDEAIAKLGEAAKGFSREGLLAVSHLGGIQGMRDFVTSGGKVNPSDSNQTSLADYYRAFSPAGSVIPSTVPQFGVDPTAGARDLGRGQFSPGAPLGNGMDELDYRRRTAAADDASTTSRRARAQADIEGTQRALEIAQRGGNTQDIANLTEQLNHQKAALDNIRTPIEQTIKGWRDQAEATKADTGASGILASKMAELEKVARDTGDVLTDKRRAEGMTAVLEGLNAEYRKTSMELDRTTKASMEQARAWLQSNDAGREAEARQKAYAEALKVGAEGTPAFVAALNTLIPKYKEVAAAARAASAGAQLQQQRNEGDTLQAQIDLARRGAGPDETARTLNDLKTKQSLDGITDPAVREGIMASSRANQEQRLQYANIKANQDELQNFFSSSFDKIGSDITQAFVNGQNAMETMGNIGKAVVSELTQEMLKLAVINPLKNLLLGNNSSLPTLGGLGGGGGGGGSFLSGLLGLFGSGAGAGIGAAGSAGTLAGVEGVAAGLGALFHSGGIVGLEPTSTRWLPASTWDGARRLHEGGMAGIASDEVPAVLKVGEGVFTPEQMKAMGGKGSGGGNVMQADFHYHAAPGGDGKVPSDEEIKRAHRAWAKEHEGMVMAVLARERGRPGGVLWR